MTTRPDILSYVQSTATDRLASTVSNILMTQWRASLVAVANNNNNNINNSKAKSNLAKGNTARWSCCMQKKSCGYILSYSPGGSAQHD